VEAQLIPCKLTLLETRHEYVPIRNGEVSGWVREKPIQGKPVELVAPALEAPFGWRLVWTSMIVEMLNISTDVIEVKTENSLYRLEFGEHSKQQPKEALPNWFITTGARSINAGASLDEVHTLSRSGRTVTIATSLYAS
jgi:hypothetical protein